MSKVIKKEIEFAGRKLSLEAGRVAFQANAAVLARYGDTVVLVSATADEPREDLDYFPLRVDYEEKLYAGGFIKTSRFIKREGRPSDDAIIAGRLIDRAIRPLFPKGFLNEVQIVVTVLSVDKESDPVVLSAVAASAALAISDIPWHGPFGVVGVGLRNGEPLLNPRKEEKETSNLDLVICGLEEKVLMIEGEAKEVPEEELAKAIEFGQKNLAPIISLINDFQAEVGKEKIEHEEELLEKELLDAVEKFVAKPLAELIKAPLDKLDWVDKYHELEEALHKEYEGKYTKAKMSLALKEIEKRMVRHLILEEGKRPDGRALDEIRPIKIEVGVLPRTHGSALFTRGLTQALTIVTLGSASLEQLIQTMTGEETKRYIHHYSAPPFSTGETAPIRSPARREIGHGTLAEKALAPVIPPKEDFPYTIRVVSEVLSQNGSTSMAASCGSSLALMDAGVPIKAPVAGIAVGLMVDEGEERRVLLTDIAGVEDFDGFMDFKLAGTRAGVTTVQMDIKLRGVSLEVIKEAILRAREARFKILDMMDGVICKPRKMLSKYAPKITVIKIDPRKIGSVIGPGGKVIKSIIEATGVAVDVDEDGTVYISATEGGDPERAKNWIEGIVKEVKVGEIYRGKVKKVTDFGAFVEILPGKEGLVHISELSHRHIPRIEKVVRVGDRFKVKVLGIDEQGRINLSKKALEKPRDLGQGEGRQRPRGAGYRTAYHQRPAYRRR